MKDLFFRPLNVDDYVVFSRYKRDSLLFFGKIAKVSSLMIYIDTISVLTDKNDPSKLNISTHRYQQRRVRKEYAHMELIKITEKDLLANAREKRIRTDSKFAGLTDAKDSLECPNCGAMPSQESFVARNEPVFHEFPDPHYKWEEAHKCTMCDSLFIIKNGT